MAIETILQHEVLTSFAYPFLLIVFITFAILVKTKLLGENQQINAAVAFVIAMIFVSAFQPKLIVGDLILFLTVALVVLFVALLLWSFLMGGGDSLKIFENASNPLKWVFGIIIVIAVTIAVLVATGMGSSVIDILFKQSWSKSLWTNVAFIVVVVVALALMLRNAR